MPKIAFPDKARLLQRDKMGRLPPPGARRRHSAMRDDYDYMRDAAFSHFCSLASSKGRRLTHDK